MLLKNLKNWQKGLGVGVLVVGLVIAGYYGFMIYEGFKYYEGTCRDNLHNPYIGKFYDCTQTEFIKYRLKLNSNMLFNFKGEFFQKSRILQMVGGLLLILGVPTALGYLDDRRRRSGLIKKKYFSTEKED